LFSFPFHRPKKWNSTCLMSYIVTSFSVKFLTHPLPCVVGVVIFAIVPMADEAQRRNNNANRVRGPTSALTSFLRVCNVKYLHNLDNCQLMTPFTGTWHFGPQSSL
jgi:hypothetical protein